MAKDKPKNGRRTSRAAGDSRPVSRKVHKPTGGKDPGGFSSPGFKSDGFKAGGKKKPRSGQAPPGVLEKERKGGPPSQRPSSPGKKKAPKKPGYPKPSMPEGWEKWKDRFPKPKPRKPKKPMPLPKGPRKPKQPMPRPKGKRPTPKKPMGKGRAK